MPFSPLDLTGILAWYDATDSDTLSTSDTAPSADGSMSDGLTVGTMFNKAGAGYIFSQATAGLRPVWHSSGSNVGSGTAYLQLWDANTAVNGNGPAMVERTTSGLRSVLNSAHTVMALTYKRGGAEGSYQVLLTNADGGNRAEFLVKISGNFKRYSDGPSTALGTSTTKFLGYSFDGSTNEAIYKDTASAVSTTSGGRPAMTSTAFLFGRGSGNTSWNGEFIEVVICSGVMSTTDIISVLDYWNTTHGTSFSTAGIPLATGTLSASSVTQTTQTLTATAAVGGTAPYTYQWYRSTTNGSAASIAVAGNLVSGATSLTLNDTGLSATTNYYYVLKSTDSVAATVLSAVLTAPTHGTRAAKIGFIGDSITAGTGSSTTPGLQTQIALQALEPTLDITIENYGQAGRRARQLSRLTYGGGGNDGGSGITAIVSAMLTAECTHVSLMLGTNDWAQSTDGGGANATYTKTNLVADLADIADACTDAGLIVYVHQLPWRTGGTNPTTGIPAWNTSIAGMSWAASLREGDVGAYAYFLANQSEMSDGLHPNTTGSTSLGGLWADAMLAGIESDVPASGDADEENRTVTVSSETRSVAATSAAYELLAQDGDVIELQVASGASGSNTKAMIYFKATQPAASATGYVIESEVQGKLVYTLSGVDLWGRAFGSDVRFVLNGTMASLD